MQKTNDRTDNIIAVILALIVYIPATTTGNLIRLGVVIVAFIMKHLKEPPEKSIRKIALCMILSPIISVIFVNLLESFNVNWALVTHEIQRMFFCALLLMTVAKMNISFRLIYIVTILVLIPNFIIQLLQRAQVGPVFDFIDKYYQSGSSAEEWTHLELAKEKGGGFRGGSIFINPNVYMVIPLMALVVFLQQDRVKSSIWNYLLIGCAVFSCFLTGSRTATIVMAVIMIWYLVKYAKAISRLILIIAILFVIYNFGSDLFSARATQVFETDSLETKINGYKWFWQSTLDIPIYWITGAIGSRVAVNGMDGEIGYIYTWYGLFGLYWYINYYKFIWRNNKQLLFYTKPIVAVHLFVALTASVLLCMPIYSYISVIVFSRLTRNNEETT